MLYRIAQNFGGVKLWRIDRFRVFLARKMLANLQQLALAPLVNGIWLGKILANDVHFAKVFRRQNIVLYSMHVLAYCFWLV